jgi:hypothetical protein
MTGATQPPVGDDEFNAILASIKAIIAPWCELKSGRPCILNAGDDGICRICRSDGSVLYEASADRLEDMLTWAKGVHEEIITRQRSEAINGACTTKSPARPRGRPLDPVVAERRRWVAETTERLAPASVRQIAYQAEVAGFIPKTENGFRRIDNTRWMRKSQSYSGIDHFIHLSIGAYRRDLWHDADAYVEIWIEKDALAGTVFEVTNPYDVPLMVARGFSSETYLYEAAQAIIGEGKPAYIYAFFDHDPSGGHSAKHIERKLRKFAPDAELHFELVAVTAQQITDWKLPTRETKRGKNRHAKNFVGDSCELDAIPPDRLRALVRDRIGRHINRDQLATLQVTEESEREALKMFAQSFRGRRP